MLTPLPGSSSPIPLHDLFQGPPGARGFGPGGPAERPQRSQGRSTSPERRAIDGLTLFGREMENVKLAADNARRVVLPAETGGTTS